MAGGGAGAHPPRVMGVADLALFYIVTGISLRWIATAAAAGPSAILIWIGAFLGFYLPLVLAVVELSSRYPEEGGLYVWTRRAFGPTVGFMVGWSYFTSNLPYFPSVFYFDAANALYIGGDRFTHLHDSTIYFVSFSLIALLAITVLNIVGLRFGKWLHNIGALGMWLPALLVIGMGAVAWWRFGSATRFDAASMHLKLDLGHMLFWSSLAFALSGCEAASFMSGEIKDARRTIPRALVISGTIVMLSYLIGTVAVLLALRPEQVNPLQGLIQAGALTSEKLGVGWLVVPLAILITLGNLGAASGFLAAASRIPFVIGIDRMLPPALGRIHPHWGTPYVAIALQGGLGALFVVVGQAGTGVKGAYDVLVSMGIIGTFIPFAMLFLSVIRLQRDPAGPHVTRLPGGAPVSIAISCIGLITTLTALVLAALPAADEPNKTLAVVKIVGGTAVLLLIGWMVKTLGTRAAARGAAMSA
jgi:amino acid transporter